MPPSSPNWAYTGVGKISPIRRVAIRITQERDALSRRCDKRFRIASESGSLSCPPSILPRGLDFAGCFFRQFCKLCEASWKEAGQFAIGFKQRLPGIAIEKVGAVHSFALECRANPAIDWSRHQADHLGRFGSFTKGKRPLR